MVEQDGAGNKISLGEVYRGPSDCEVYKKNQGEQNELISPLE